VSPLRLTGSEKRSRPRATAWQLSANRATEANHVSVGVGDKSFSFAIILVPEAENFDPSLSPFLSHPISVMAVDVENTVTWKVVA
jgi:hypothetical protein